MVDPFGLTGELVKGLLESAEGVRTNREECALLVDRAKQTLALLNQIKSKMIVDQTLSKAIDYVNECLKKAQDAIDNCCNTSCLCALLLHRTHSLELYRAEKDLNYALFQIPLAALGMTLNIQDDLAALVDGKSHDKFEERAARTHQTNTLKREIEQIYNRINQGFLEVSTRTNQEFEVASVQTSQVCNDASAQKDRQTENVENYIGQMQKLGLHLDRTRALLVATTLVKDISEISAKAKTSEDGCMLVARLAKQTLRFLDKFVENAVANSLALDALRQVNEALANVKHSVDDCCNPNIFEDAMFRERHSSRLKESATMLGNALAEMSPLLNEMSSAVQSALSSLCKEIHDTEFHRRVDVERDNTLSKQSSNVVETSQPSPSGNKQYPLPFARFTFFAITIKELIASGFDVDNRNEDGQTPLWIASEYNQIDIVKALIANGAEVDLPNKNGVSPLFIASQKGHLNVVKELIASGAKVDLRNKNGASPLYIASQNGHLHVELIAKSANVDLRKKNRWTPLHIAASLGRVPVVQVLLEHGASKDARNNWLRKPFHVVCTNQSFGPYENTTIEELKSLLKR